MELLETPVMMSKNHQTKLPCLQSGKGATEKFPAIVGKFGGDRERSEDFLRTVGACRQLRP